MKTPVRVRFAPSPTGFLNLGGARSALFNWLLARQSQGQFILRLEDTDRQRLVPESVDQIQQSLRWLGLEWNEGITVGGPHGPYVQSERLQIYRQQADYLVEQGYLYPCWCSPERLSKLRQAADQAKKPFKYDRYCLTHPSDTSRPHVLRFKIPDHPGKVSWNDAVKGHISVKTADLDDFVALKSDGFPTYHLANVIDDHLMGISHVLRADEWLPSTPKHLLMFAAFGWPAPVYAHLPAVLGRSGSKKLSKRDGAQQILDYRDQGYLPDALINFLALLGWNEGDGSTKEIYSHDELIKAFSLERVQTSPAVFDPDRLDWMNGLYIRALAVDQLAQTTEAFWPPEAKKFDLAYKKAVLTLVQERLKKLSELPDFTSFFFTDPGPEFEATLKQVAKPEWKKYLDATLETLKDSDFTVTDLEQRLRQLALDLNTKRGMLFGALRLAITGQTNSPPLFETMATLGQDAVLRRLKNTQKAL